jgi:predicted nucleic acid-binding protein
MPDDLFVLDTSVWLEVLPPGRGSPALRERVDGLLSADLVATTGMVRLELLGGARSLNEWDRLQRLLSALHPLPIDDGHWEEAGRMGFQLRRQGSTVPFTDLLIGAVAMRAGVVVVHRDRHFDLAASHLPLKVESYVAD